MSFIQDVMRNKVLYLMILPVLIYFFIFAYVPMVGLYLAFTSFDFNLGFFRSPFAGFENFRYMFETGIIYRITRNTILFNLVFILLGNLLQLFSAILLSELPSKLFKKLAQSAMFLPYFISFVLVGVFALNLFHYDYGLINSILVSLGLERVDFYSTPSYWKYIITFFHLWKWIGYGTVIYLAAILSIDQEIYESARIDGASVVQQIVKITVPILTPTLVILVLFSIGNMMKGQFELFYQLVGTNGMLFEVTDIIDTYVYRSLMVTFDIGMGSAAGLYQSFFGLLLILFFNAIAKRANKEYALF